ncbi:MAG: hypothetical protein AB1942_17910 [Pseudomonadota bacterium]
MKRLLPALILALAPAAAQALDLPVRLRDGATWTQTSVHTRTDTREGATRSTTATSVTRSTYRKEAGVGTLRVDFVSFDVDGVEGEAKAALAEKARLVYPAVLEVDDALIPTRVRDWDKMRETIFQALAASIPDAPALDAAKSMFAGMDAVQAASLFKEQGLVALGQGADLEPGQASPYDSEIPNILGGPPIKASGAFRLDAVDKARERAVLTWSQTPDAASMAASLKVSMEAMSARVAPDKQAEAKARLANLTLERQEGCRYEIDMATGLAATTDCTVEIRAGLPPQIGLRTERWVITQSVPEPR